MGNCKGICCSDQPDQLVKDTLITKDIEHNLRTNEKDTKLKIKKENITTDIKINNQQPQKNQVYVPINNNNSVEKSQQDKKISIESISQISDADQNSNVTSFKEGIPNKIANSNELVAATIGKNEIVELPPIIMDNQATYTGCWSNGMRNAKGVQVWPDESKYEGDWVNDKACGNGKLTHTDGDIYEGQWENDKANGHGIYYHTNGAKYVIFYLL